MKRIFPAIILLASLLTSCFSAKIEVKKGNIPHSPKVLILGTEINPYGHPRKNGMAEVWFNIKPNKNSEEIQKISASRINTQKEILSRHFQKIFKAEVLNNDQINTLIEKNNWQKFNRNIETGDKYFPVIFCSTPGIHPITYLPKEIRKLNDIIPSFQNEIKIITQKTDADIFVLSVSEPKVFGVGAGGFLAKIQLEIHLFVFDKNGELISSVNGNSKPITTNGKDTGDFMEVLDEYNQLSEKLVELL